MVIASGEGPRPMVCGSMELSLLNSFLRSITALTPYQRYYQEQYRCEGQESSLHYNTQYSVVSPPS